MSEYIKNAGTWINTKDTWIKNAGVWYRINQTWLKDGGVWYQTSSPPVYKYSSYYSGATVYWIQGSGTRVWNLQPLPMNPRSPAGGVATATYSETVSDSFIVPLSVSQITVSLWGGGGSSGWAGQGVAGSGGGGGFVKAVINVTPGETLTIRVGGGGGHPYPIFTPPRPAEKNPGLYHSSYSVYDFTNFSTALQIFQGGIGGCGGGYSGIFRGATPLVIAGGGGGGGGGGGIFLGSDSVTAGNGGAGGSATGQSGTSGSGGRGFAGLGGSGGTQSSGGSSGNNGNAGVTGGTGGQFFGGGGGNGNYDNLSVVPLRGSYAAGGINGGGWGGAGRRGPDGVLYFPADCGAGGGAGYFGGGGGQCGAGDGGGAGGGGSNYVGGAVSVIYNLRGNFTQPGDIANGVTIPERIATFLVSGSGLSSSPTYSFLQGGVGYGGPQQTPTPGLPTVVDGTNLYNNEFVKLGNRGENGLVVINW